MLWETSENLRQTVLFATQTWLKGTGMVNVNGEERSKHLPPRTWKE
jgi:hypothetical protein